MGVDVTHPGYWSLALDSVLLGPSDEVEAVALMLGAKKIHNLYVVTCSAELPSLAFKLGGQDFVLEKDDLVIQKVGRLCVLGLSAINLPQRMWILGDVFMRKYYVQFDWGRKRVGLAKAATGARNQNLV